MLRRLLFLTSLCVSLTVVSQCGDAQTSERLVRIDTVQISASIKRMIFKYFRNDDGYNFSDPSAGKMLGRFEIYFLGSSLVFQKDTVDEILDVSYEDANFDNILDMRILRSYGGSGGDFTDYWFYDTTARKFEFGLGDLSDPGVDKRDSTITSSSTCCAGTGGGSEVYKLTGGEFRKIKELSYSRDGLTERQLIGDTLITTRLETEAELDDGVHTDSCWDYLFGKLRLVLVDLKVPLDESVTPKQSRNGTAYEDVGGRFSYILRKTFKYTEVGKGTIQVIRTVERVKNSKWFTVNKTKSLIQE